jgi:hypothetical protein
LRGGDYFLAFGVGKGLRPDFRLGLKPELYRQDLEALDWGKPKTVGLRQDKSQEFLEFGLF